uniref:p-protein n=1 Tax=Hofstenia miamia TaxID=442651 RepID=A0A8K1R290_HOFMI|nr:p-protein [Hofstenia miamia]
MPDNGLTECDSSTLLIQSNIKSKLKNELEPTIQIPLLSVESTSSAVSRSNSSASNESNLRVQAHEQHEEETKPLLNDFLRRNKTSELSLALIDSSNGGLPQSLESSERGSKRHIISDVLKYLETLTTPKQRHYIKIAVLSVIGIVSALAIIYLPETHSIRQTFCVSKELSHRISLADFYNKDIRVKLSGPFLPEHSLSENSTKNLSASVCAKNFNENCFKHYNFYINTSSNTSDNYREEEFVIHVERSNSSSPWYMIFRSNSVDHYALSIDLLELVDWANYQVYAAAFILVFLYSLIISEIIHRTIAACLAATMGIATLALCNEGPSIVEVVEWVDWETLMLLFGMMVLVAIFAESGFFDYAAVLAYRAAQGKQWRLITLLSVFAGVISAFLDNVTTILLMSPVTIKLCEVLNMEAKWVLIAEVIMSNIGGTATAIGDPPNVLIVSNKGVQNQGVDFLEFTRHLSIGSSFCMIFGMIAIRLLYRNKDLFHNEDPEIRQLKKELHMWKKTAKRIGSVSREENSVKEMLFQYIRKLEDHIHKKMRTTSKKRQSDWKSNLESLEQRYVIRDKILLMQSGSVLVVVVLLFFTQSSKYVNTELGWIAFLGALVLLILADVEDMEEVLHKVEWSTLMFFAALFVLMEALTKLGLIHFIGDQTENIIAMIPESYRFLMALIIILWVSALASSFIDNIPFTSAMIPIIIQLGQSPHLHMKPLLWSLAYGACLGGNGTLIGASANVVCAGVAEQKGYKITFCEFFKVGFPVMLSTVFIAMIYLLICHIVLQWGID